MKLLATKQLYNHFFPNNVVAATTDKQIDFAYPAGNAQLTQQQQDYIDALTGFTNTPVVNIKQVHGERIVVLQNKFDSTRYVVEQADAIITNITNLAIAVRTADCLPVLLWAPQPSAIGVVHAGWKGTQLQIAAKTVRQMVDIFSVDPSAIKIALGPAIRKEAYEVGDEFAEYFPESTERIGGKCHLDLIKENRRQLTGAGIKSENIFDCQICTFSDNIPRGNSSERQGIIPRLSKLKSSRTFETRYNYFSHRRDAERAGRMVSLMMLKSIKE